MRFLQIVIYALAAITVLSIVYRLLPHRAVAAKKPKFALFPKYIIPNPGSAEIGEVLESLNFERRSDSNVYVRGSYFGDFSASRVRLNVVVTAENIYVHSPLIVIFFDTGDLWEIASAVSGRIASD